MPHAVSVIEMVGARIVEIHRQFYQAQTQQPGIKIKVGLKMTAIAVM